MPSGGRSRRLWLGFAAVLFTMAVWAQSISVPLVISTLFVYFAVRINSDRSHLASDLVMIGAIAIAVTAA